jgi:hypothetical protein
VPTIQAFESGALDLKNFYFTGDDYRYRIEIEAKRRFLGLLKDRFNSGVKYRDKTWKWDIVILTKTQELGRFLLGESDSLAFSEPIPDLERGHDHEDLRQKILKLAQGEAYRLGISKSTLHCMRVRARTNGHFRAYQKTVDRLVARG